MKRQQFSFCLILLWIFSWHSNGLAFWPKVVDELHKNVGLTTPTGGSEDAISISFTNPTSSYFLDKNIFKDTAINIERIQEDTDDIHPLSVFFYIAFAQGKEVPLEFVDEWQCTFEQNDRIGIIADMYTFAMMIGDDSCLAELQNYIVEFLSKELDGLTLSAVNALVDDGVITNKTASFLSFGIGGKLREENQDRRQRRQAEYMEKHNGKIKTQAEELVRKIDQKKEKYRKRLTEKMSNLDAGRQMPHVRISKDTLHDKDVKEIWKQACDIFNDDVEHHENAFELSVIKPQDSCEQCCCCFWCFICCCPCMTIRSCMNDCPGGCEEGIELWIQYKEIKPKKKQKKRKENGRK